MNTVIAILALNAAADSASISVPLQRTSADRNASGLARITLSQTNSSMVVQVTNLTRGRTYAVAVGGQVRGRFVAGRDGRAQLRFTQPPAAGALPFNFDPRGQQLLVLQNETTVLRARISGPGEPPASALSEEATLPRTQGTTAGRAEATYTLTGGTRNFSVTLTNVADGNWILYVDGIRRGTIAVSGGGGAIAFDNDSATPEPALNFDPRGVVIDLVRGGIVRFSGPFAARANGINVARPSIQTRYLFNVGTAPAALARAERWIDHDARRGLDIEVVNVPPGDYEIYVDGVFKGFMPVFATPAGSFGEMKFVSHPDDEEEQALTFSPFGSSYVIQVLGTLFFAGEPIAIDVGDTDVATIVPVRLRLPLFNLGADRNAAARAEFKRDDRGSRHFEMVLRNLAVGEYSLIVDDVLVGTIQVVAAGNGTRGIIEFEDEPEIGEELLSFDPLGRTIRIEREGTRYFERTLPVNP